MHRFYVAPDQSAAARVTLCPRETHHALHVLRVRAGESVELLDGRGHILEAQVVRTGRREVELQVCNRYRVAAPGRRLALVVALTKGAAFEDILQRATELGVAELHPVVARRSVVRLEERDRPARLEKWHWTMVDALKQCGGAWLPEVTWPEPLESWLARARGWEWQVYGALIGARGTLRARIHAYRQDHGGRLPRTIAAYVGPEGDFTVEERAALEQAGVEPVSLGSRVLRSATAAMYLASVFHYEWLEEETEPAEPT